MASKLSPQQTDDFFFTKVKWNFVKNGNFCKFCTRKFSSGNFFRGKHPRTQDSEYVYETGVEDLFDRVLPARSWEVPAERELPLKIGWCNENLAGHNF